MITIPEVREPVFLCSLQRTATTYYRWATGQRDVVYGGNTYTVTDVPIIELFGIGRAGGFDKTIFGVRLADPEFVYRNEYRNAYINKEIQLIYVPAPGATGIIITLGYCSKLSAVTSEQGRVTSFEFINRLGRLGGHRPRTTTKDNQRRFHPDDSGMDVAQQTLAVNWGTSAKS